MIQENPVQFGPAFHGTEHPDTAAQRIKKDYVDTMISLKRENMERVYSYVTGLMDKGKEELGHARSGGSSAEHRKAALRQHIDEIGAYLKGQALDVAPPATGADGHYLIDDVAPFFGRVKCVMDQWYDSHLIAMYDEMIVLTNLKGKPSPVRE
ncbi:hypothetical protein [Novosphingobium sp.]|uniref:hypothetical protein n=1 Tax=Novosphingobium sp. TaxID=1874826 RepID=UPI0025FAEEEC|nr:hypothetical protein [Novosphingobium sp.]